MLPAVLAVLPGLVAGLAGAGNRIGAPGRLAGVEIGRLDIAADAELAAGGADDREVAHDQRRDGQRLAERGIGDLALPHLLAGRLVDGEHAAVERDRDHLVLPQRDAAVVDAAAGDVAGPGLVGAGVELPLERALLAGGDVDRIDRAPAVRHVHDAVLDQRRRFEVAERIASAALEAAERHRERQLQVLDGIGVDLLERGEPVALVIAVMEDPVLRLALRIERALGRHVGGAQPASARWPPAASRQRRRRQKRSSWHFSPLGRACFLARTFVRESFECIGKSARFRHPRRGMLGGQYISMPRAGCHAPSLALDRHRPNAGAAERGEVGRRWAAFRPRAPYSQWATSQTGSGAPLRAGRRSDPFPRSRRSRRPRP